MGAQKRRTAHLILLLYSYNRLESYLDGAFYILETRSNYLQSAERLSCHFSKKEIKKKRTRGDGRMNEEEQQYLYPTYYTTHGGYYCTTKICCVFSTTGSY